MGRRNFFRLGASLLALGGMGATGAATAQTSIANAAKPLTPAGERAFMVDLLRRMVEPVLLNQAKGTLKSNFLLQFSDTWDGRDSRIAYFEAFARGLAGAAPWLALPDDDSAEGELRSKLRIAAQQGLANGVNPDSPDYFMWKGHDQCLVEAAYICSALIRAPAALWEPLDATTKQRLLKELRETRRIVLHYNNWVLFPAIVEAFFLLIGEEWDPVRIEYSIRKIDEWYAGDGWINDGSSFHFDYYNSYVMYPMTIEVLEVVVAKNVAFTPIFKPAELLARFMKRAQRYCEHLERLVSPVGSYPPLGRSTPYRTSAFQPMALLSLRRAHSDKLSNGQVRAAMTAVHRAIFGPASSFNKGGYLTIGFAGEQTSLGDRYSNNGSMYLTSLSFLPLGLPADDPYWTEPAQDWTQKKAFSGQSIPRDYAVSY